MIFQNQLFDKFIQEYIYTKSLFLFENKSIYGAKQKLVPLKNSVIKNIGSQNVIYIKIYVIMKYVIKGLHFNI